MAVRGTRIETIPGREIEVTIKSCDICGMDATGRSGCARCEKDLCGKHQLLIISGIRNGVNSYTIVSFQEDDKKEFRVISGATWCKECLIKAIGEIF